MLIAWQTFPDNQVAPEFADWLDAALTARDVERDEQVFHLPLRRRSRMAAEAMAAAGYRRCRNVAEGFEGPIDADRHRTRSGKFAGLAWVQG
jgi:hypothetical protein